MKPVPNRHVMAILTWLGLIPMVYFIPPFLAEFLSHSQFWVTLTAVTVIVPLITYIWLPFTTKLLVKFKNN